MDTHSNTINHLFSIEDKVALVTGGTSGIGFMVAKAFVENGAKVYITARTAKDCEETAKNLSALGQCIGIPCDLSTEAGRETLVNGIQENEQSLDILVHNAGIAIGGELGDPFEKFPAESWDQTMNVNTRSPFILTQKLMPLLTHNATADMPAKIINMGSVAGIKVVIDDNENRTAGSYGPSKALLHHMTKDWAAYLAHRHILVNAIAPGPFPSRIMSNPDFQKDQASRTRLGRLGNETDMAGIALFLASRASGYITGEVIKVDGGFTL